MANVYTNLFEAETEKKKGLSITNQGGEAYAIDCFRQLRRFLILGSDRPTFYASAEKLTQQNVKAVKEALDIDGIRVVKEIIDVSDRALAPSNEYAIVALSMAASYQNKERPKYAASVRSYALNEGLQAVARTGTHLFHFANYVDKQRGWGSGLRKAFANWYLDKSPMALANQVTKYQQRDGWSHADLLRLSHPVARTEVQNTIFKYVVDGVLPEQDNNNAIQYLMGVEEIKSVSDEKEAIALIEEFNLPREVIPTHFLNSPKVWEALLLGGESGMPFTAMLRNLGTMSKVGLLTQGSDATTFVLNQLNNEEAIKRARIHPIDVIKAKFTYQAGRGLRSDATWNPVNSIVTNLEKSFYLSFGNVVPTNKRIILALDVSGSMTMGQLAGVSGLTPRVATGLLAMVTARTERDYEILGFSNRLIGLGISGNDSLDAVIRKIDNLPFGGTDCALPMRYAMQNDKKFDAFCVYTDNETGGSNPSAALKQYRQKSGINAKLVVNAMTAGNFSIADPNDGGMLDIVGFDSSAPQVQSAFIRGEI